MNPLFPYICCLFLLFTLSHCISSTSQPKLLEVTRTDSAERIQIAEKRIQQEQFPETETPQETKSLPETKSAEKSVTIKTFSAHFGGKEYDNGLSLVETQDNGFLAVGYTFSFAKKTKSPDDPDFLVSNSDILLIKLDASGHKQWQKVLGGDFPEGAESVIQLPDGYLLAGHQYQKVGEVKQKGTLFPKLRNQAWLCKINTQGDVVWQKTFGAQDTEETFQKVILTKDGNFIAVGSLDKHKQDIADRPIISTPNPTSTQRQGWVVKLNPQGEILWQTTVSGPSQTWDTLVDVTMTNNHMIAVGATRSFSEGTSGSYVVRLGFEQGNVVWQKAYPTTSTGKSNNTAHAVVKVDDQNFALVGVSGKHVDFGKQTVDGNIRFLTFDLEGQKQIDKTFDISGAGQGIDEGIDLLRIPDGFVILAAVQYDIYMKAYEESNVMVVQIDEQANMVWKSLLGTPKKYDYPSQIISTQDRGFAVVGSTQAFVKEGEKPADNLYVLKLNPQGRLEQ